MTGRRAVPVLVAAVAAALVVGSPGVGTAEVRHVPGERARLYGAYLGFLGLYVGAGMEWCESGQRGQSQRQGSDSHRFLRDWIRGRWPHRLSFDNGPD